MAHKKAQAGKTRFGVVAGPGEVRRVLGILRLDTVLALYPQLDMALAATDCDPPGGQQGPQAEGQPKTRPGDRGASDGGAVA